MDTRPGARHTLLMPKRFLPVVLCLLIAAGGCGAGRPTRNFSELPQRLKPGNTVYVIDDRGVETRGKVVELSAAALTLDVAGVRQLIDEAGIRRVDRYGDSLWNGFVIGAVVATPGVLISDPQKGGTPHAGKRALAIGVMGTIGAGIDALFRSRRPVYRAP